MTQLFCVITGIGGIIFYFILDDINRLNNKMNILMESVGEKESSQYIECPDCAEIKWNVGLSVCEDCNFVD